MYIKCLKYMVDVWAVLGELRLRVRVLKILR